MFLLSFRFANVFLHPVTEDIAPGYKIVVHRPMDLSAIKKNIETGHTRTTSEFQRDMMLMFTNAIMYNNSDHNVYNMAVTMYDDVMVSIEVCQFHYCKLTDFVLQSLRSDVPDPVINDLGEIATLDLNGLCL
jgi:hypothetical protein